MPERVLLTHDYTPIAAANGDTITTLDDTAPQPLITRRSPLTTPNSRLTSKDRHILARSSGATVIARSTGRDIFARGGTQPYILSTADYLIQTPPVPVIVNEYGLALYGLSTYTASASNTYGSSYGSGQYA